MRRIFIAGLLVLSVGFGIVSSANAQSAPGTEGLWAQLRALQAQLTVLLEQARVQQISVPVPSVPSEPSAPVPSHAIPSMPSGYITIEEVAGNPTVSCTLPSIRLRSSGPVISLLQLILKQDGSYPEGFVTGYYGKLTEAAVSRFQSAYGIPATGIVDAATAKALTKLTGKFYPDECRNIVEPPSVQCEYAAPPTGCRYEGPMTYPQCEARLVCDSAIGEGHVYSFDNINNFYILRGDNLKFVQLWSIPTGTEITPAYYKHFGDMILESDGSQFDVPPGSVRAQKWSRNIKECPLLATNVFARAFDATGRQLPDVNLPVTGASALYEYLCGNSSSITVTSPNGGETWSAGGTYSVRWSGGGRTVSLRLIDQSLESIGGSASIVWRAENIPNTGSYQFHVPVFSGTYRFYIDDASMNGYSGYFQIVGAQSGITVTSPRAGETWRVGEQRRIAWTTNDPSMRPIAGRVSITLNSPRPFCLDSSPQCLIAERMPYVIAENVPDTGSYAWSIPTNLPDTYRGAAQITVARTSAPATLGRSGMFEISRMIQPPTSTVSLDVQLASTPTSGTYPPGSQNVPLVGVNLRATGGTVRVTELMFVGASMVGRLDASEVGNFRLYDGATMVGGPVTTFERDGVIRFRDLMGGDGVMLVSGQTKSLVVRGDLYQGATPGEVYYFYLQIAQASDPNGNPVRISGYPVNSNGTVRITVGQGGGTVGDVSAVTAPSDTESEAGILVAGREQVLSKIRFTATGEDMRVNKLQLLVNDRNDAGYRTNAAADEVPLVRLYNTNGEPINSGGYTVQTSGDNAGVVMIEQLGWNIPRDTSKTLVVKGVMNSIANGADSGASVYAHLMNRGFEAAGANGVDTTIQAASGYEKVAYKTKPTVTVASTGATLGASLTPIIRITVAADSAESVSLKKVQVRIAVVGARVAAVDVQPGVSGNVTLRPLGGSNLNILRAYSGPTAQGMQNVEIPSGSTGYVTFLLNTEEVISAGSSKTYELSVTFADIVSNQAAAGIQVFRAETMRESARSVRYLEGESNETSTFIWSDNSATGHSEQTNDWSNGVYVKTLPSDQVSVQGGVTPPPPSNDISISTPAQGDIWNINDTNRVIRWTYPTALAGRNVELTVSLASADGSATWTIYQASVGVSSQVPSGGEVLWSYLKQNYPSGAPPAGTYTVYVHALDLSSQRPYSGRSDTFNLATPQPPTPTPQITVISPNGGEVYRIGNSFRTSWTYNAIPPENTWLALYVIKDGREVYNPLTTALNTVNYGYYDWLIPSNSNNPDIMNGGDFKIRAKIYNYTTGQAIVSDESNAPFTIVGTTQTNNVTFTGADIRWISGITQTTGRSVYLITVYGAKESPLVSIVSDTRAADGLANITAMAARMNGIIGDATWYVTVQNPTFYDVFYTLDGARSGYSAFTDAVTFGRSSEVGAAPFGGVVAGAATGPSREALLANLSAIRQQLQNLLNQIR